MAPGPARRFEVRVLDRWRRSFYALWVAQILALIGFSSAIPFLPLFLTEVGVATPSAVVWWSGSLFSASAITMAATSPVWGLLADRFGRKIMVQRAIFSGGFLLALMGLSRNVYDLLALRMAQGAFTGTVSAAAALAASVSPRHLLGRNVALMQTAVYAGASLGPFFGGLLVDRIGYRPVFFLTGGMVGVGGLIVTALVKEDFQRSQTAAPWNVRGLRRDLTAVVTSPVLLAMNLVLFAVHVTTSGFVPILALFVREISGDGANAASQAGLLLGSMAISSMLSAFAAARFGDRIGYARVLVWCLFAASFSTVALFVVRGMLGLVVLFFVEGLFVGAVVPSTSAIIGRRAPPEMRGIAFGLTGSATALGMTVGPLLGSTIAATIGLADVFLVTGLILAAVAVIVSRLMVVVKGGSIGHPDHNVFE